MQRYPPNARGIAVLGIVNTGIEDSVYIVLTIKLACH